MERTMPFDDTKLATQVGFLILNLWKLIEEKKELQALIPHQEEKSKP
jgi:hypothetical protein